MTEEERQTLLAYRMERSRESLQAAQLLLNNTMLIPAMNRIYYALFYAVQALLVVHNVAFSKHGQVKGYFNREFIKPGIFPMQFGKLYNTIFEYRQKFDYVDFAVPEPGMVGDYLKEATEFLACIEQYLQENIRGK